MVGMLGRAVWSSSLQAALPEKFVYRKDFSRKDAKAQSATAFLKGFLCAFAPLREKYFFPGVFTLERFGGATLPTVSDRLRPARQSSDPQPTLSSERQSRLACCQYRPAPSSSDRFPERSRRAAACHIPTRRGRTRISLALLPSSSRAL